MLSIVVVGDKNQKLSRLISDFLKKRELCVGVLEAKAGKNSCDIAVLCGGYIPNCDISATALVADGELAAENGGHFQTPCLVTCGLSALNTVTASSTKSGRELASLQRQLVALSGKTLEPIELPIGHLPGTVEEKLLICGVLLLLGKKP